MAYLSVDLKEYNAVVLWVIESVENSDLETVNYTVAL
jgi:hypothetical protein